jgi:nitroimidazol reductase NimA-like FMN-containing flavoprotein (pyridoxamine 5'-phosphate oxidase superfamily)
MANKNPIAEKLPSNADHAAPTPWEVARRTLAEGQWYWLASVRPDAQPHLRPVLAVWVDDAICFCSGHSTRKGKNLAQNSHCSLSVASDTMHLVVEGEAVKINDEAKLQRVADVYASKYDWHVTVRDGVFYADYGAPTAGPPPFEVYEIAPTVAFGFGTEESFSPTRWRF